MGNLDCHEEGSNRRYSLGTLGNLENWAVMTGQAALKAPETLASVPVLSQSRDGTQDAGDFQETQIKVLSCVTVVGKALEQ